jgi:hypothetical protein
VLVRASEVPARATEVPAHAAEVVGVATTATSAVFVEPPRKRKRGFSTLR